MRITADQLRAVRRYLDMTQAEFANHLDVSQRTIVNWESSGVPESKTLRVHRILKPAIDELDDIEAMTSAPPPEPPPGWNDEGIPDEVNRLWIPGGLKTMPPSPTERRARLLAPFTNIDLIEELHSRARKSGERATVWNAERVEQYQRYIAPDWEEMTQEGQHQDEYDVAAFEQGLGDGIEPDDLPDQT